MAFQRLLMASASRGPSPSVVLLFVIFIVSLHVFVFNIYFLRLHVCQNADYNSTAAAAAQPYKCAHTEPVSLREEMAMF